MTKPREPNMNDLRRHLAERAARPPAERGPTDPEKLQCYGPPPAIRREYLIPNLDVLSTWWYPDAPWPAGDGLFLGHHEGQAVVRFPKGTCLVPADKLAWTIMLASPPGFERLDWMLGYDAGVEASHAKWQVSRKSRKTTPADEEEVPSMFNIGFKWGHTDAKSDRAWPPLRLNTDNRAWNECVRDAHLVWPKLYGKFPDDPIVAPEARVELNSLSRGLVAHVLRSEPHSGGAEATSGDGGQP